MATRGVIAYAINFDEASCKRDSYIMACNYLHYDSMISEAGVCLLSHYSNIDTLRELVTHNKGGIAFLDTNLDKCGFLEGGEWLEVYPSLDKKDILANFAKYIKKFGGDIEYAYLFLDYTWFVWVKRENSFEALTYKLLPIEKTLTHILTLGDYNFRIQAIDAFKKELQ